MKWIADTTIVALATPEGESGLSVVRVSGAKSLEIAAAIFPHASFGSDPRSHKALQGTLVWPDGNTKPDEHIDPSFDLQPGTPIDSALVLPMRAPNSYTGEDTVEFFCHGGRMPARLVIAACISAGAIPAEKGEFTRRSFLNGKLSLDQAEAVIDLIHAENQLGARAALAQLKGGLDEQLITIETPLRELLARIEGSLEFGEDEGVEVEKEEANNIIIQSINNINKLLSFVPAGRRLREGIHVVLVGLPNVGKSSLFNHLVGNKRVLVDSEAGTTRDVVTATVQREGTSFVFHDTAGIHETDVRVEKMGIELTRDSIRRADIILQLSEYESGGSVDEDLVQLVKKNMPGDCRVINVTTKTDLLPASEKNITYTKDSIHTSSATGNGIEAVWSGIVQHALDERMREAIAHGVVLNQRHKDKLKQCRDGLESLHGEMKKQKVPDEVLGTLLGTLVADLGEMSGRVYNEDILETIFSRFCIGK